MVNRYQKTRKIVTVFSNTVLGSHKKFLCLLLVICLCHLLQVNYPVQATSDKDSKQKADSPKQDDSPKVDPPKQDAPKKDDLPKVDPPKDITTDEDNGKNKEDKQKPEKPKHIEATQSVAPIKEEGSQIITSSQATTIIQGNSEHQADNDNKKNDKQAPDESKIQDQNKDNNIHTAGGIDKGDNQIPDASQASNQNTDNSSKQKPNTTITTTEAQNNNNGNPTPTLTSPNSTPLPVPEECSCSDINIDNQSEENNFCEEICAEKTGINSNTNTIPEIPKGSTVALDASVTNSRSRTTETIEELGKEINSAVLIDNEGNKFDVGIILPIVPNNNPLSDKNKFKSVENEILDLTAIIEVPITAATGDAKVLILSGDQQLSTIKLKIISPQEVKIGKKKIFKPQIRDPISAQLAKTNERKMQLIMKIRGKNFIGRIAIIDGQLQKLIDKSQFFTNITFVPNEGIKIKEFRVLNSEEIVLTADIADDITPGIKFFNVITPRGIDAGAIIFPDSLAEGVLETTSNLKSIILNNNP